MAPVLWPNHSPYSENRSALFCLLCLASSSCCFYDAIKHILVKCFVTSKLFLFWFTFFLLMFDILNGRINAIHHFLLSKHCRRLHQNRSQCIDSRKLLTQIYDFFTERRKKTHIIQNSHIHVSTNFYLKSIGLLWLCLTRQTQLGKYFKLALPSFSTTRLNVMIF